MTLEQFTKELKSNELWLEAMRGPSRFKDLDAAIAKVYGQVISDETIKSKPMTEHRKHVFNVLGTMPFGKQTGVQLQQEKPKEEAKEEKPIESVPYEVHQKRLQEWLNSIAKLPEVKRVPKLTSKEIMEEGQWEPKQKPTYHRDPMEIIRHEYKIKYAREFSDPLSYEGRLLPGAPDFETWMQEERARQMLNGQ